MANEFIQVPNKMPIH